MNTTARKEKRPRAQRRRAFAEVETSSMQRKNANEGWFFAIVGCAFLLRLIYLRQIESIPLFYHLAGDEWAQRLAAGDWLGDGVFYQAPFVPLLSWRSELPLPS